MPAAVRVEQPGPRIGLDLIRRAGRDDLARDHHVYVVCGPEHEVDVVLDQHDGHAAHGEATQQRLQPGRLDRVETARGLVE